MLRVSLSMLIGPAAIGLALMFGANAYPIAVGDKKGQILEIQAHRGGLGLRPESTLWAFAYALEIGADVLEMDTVFSQDGIPVIWHDHWIYPTKCRGTVEGANYVGKYIANLTLAQVKTLDCGSQQIEDHPQTELHPGARIATLEEVLNLVECYGDEKVQINLETKLDPVASNQTLPVSKYISELVPILQRRGFAERTYIQSFDWRTIIGIKEKFPETRTVALLDDTTIIPEDRGVGGYPWLGGIDLEKDFNGGYIAAAAFINATVLSPVHGLPSNGTVNTPGYVPFTTAEMVKAAHEFGLWVVPWTVEDESTIDKLIT
ncbi:hypothetical protein RUND412_006629 [Rhizina undulata]